MYVIGNFVIKLFAEQIKYVIFFQKIQKISEESGNFDIYEVKIYIWQRN